MTKILHLGDTHLGYKQYGLQTRFDDYCDAVDAAFTFAINNGIKAIILAGDVFDSAKPVAEAVERLQASCRRAGENGVAVVGIDGNHDPSEGKWLRVCDITPLHDNTVKVGDVILAGINFTASHTRFKEQIDAYIDKGVKIDVLVIHQAVREMAGFSTREMSANDIAEWVKPLGVKYVAMGDIHITQEAVFNGVSFVYPGPLEMQATDEPRNKVYMVVEFDGNSLSNIRTYPATYRNIVEHEVRALEDVQKTVTAVRKDLDSFHLIYYDSGNKGLKDTLTTNTRAVDALYRLIPLKREGESVIQSHDRTSAMTQLTDAITVFFDDDSDEARLVKAMLDSPDNTRQIIYDYFTTETNKDTADEDTND